MKKLLCILQIFALLMSASTTGEVAPVDYWDGQVHYLLSGHANETASVTPFTARPYRFSSPDRIVSLFWGDSGDCLKAEENDENLFYTGDGETLIISKPDQAASLHFDSEYSEAVFTPIQFVEDVYAFRTEVENWEQELSFMSRDEAEAEAERFVCEIFEGLCFRSIATFAITRSEYEAQYEARRDELETWFAIPKMSEGMRRWVDFPQEDLGYLICLAQEVNDLPIAWSFFQNVPAAPLNQSVELWLFWTPEGCKYLSTDYQVMAPLENTDACTVLSRTQALETFSEAYNYTIGAKEIEVWDAHLVWFTDMNGDDSNGTRLVFRPMWCMYVPKFYNDDGALRGEFGYWVDAVTGETWV